MASASAVTSGSFLDILPIKGLCTKDVHPKGGRGGFKIVDENGHGGRGGSGRMDVHFSGPSKI